MKLNHYLGALWIIMALVMIVQWRIDYLMIGALIIIPILIVLHGLREELTVLKEEAKHQRKFIMDRYTALSDKIKDFGAQLEKRMVVDFAEFAKNNLPPPAHVDDQNRRRKKRKKKPIVTLPVVDFHSESKSPPTTIEKPHSTSDSSEPHKPEEPPTTT